MPFRFENLEIWHMAIGFFSKGLLRFTAKFPTS